jgi:hypothetical protein
MFSKKTIPVVGLLLLVAAALIAGASQIVSQQVPGGQIVVADGATRDNGRSGPALPASPALPAAAGTVALLDSFDGPQLPGWSTLADAPGRWVTNSGRLEQWGNVDGETSNDTTVLVANGSAFGDGKFEAQVFPMSGESVGVVFRGSDAGYYRVSLYPNLPNNAPKARLHKITPNGAQELAVNTTWAGFTQSQWQRIEVAAAGGRFTVSVDGTNLFVASDSAFRSGWIGVWTIADRGALFDNVRVQRDVAGR